MPTLGRLVEHDERSRAFAFTPRTLTLPPYSVTHPRRVPIFNQDLQGPGGTGLGSCTANAGIGWVGSDPRARRSVTEADVVPFYSEVTRADQFAGQWEPDDTGSSGLAVARVLKRRGWLSRYEHAFSFRAFLAALVERPVIIGIPWLGDMFHPLSSGYLKCTGEEVGGHEVLVRGIDPKRKHVLCDNSWGYDWSRRGRFWLHWSDLEMLLSRDGDATIMYR